ncbi:hypothetical protein NECAME_18938, partial [Necator americanus]
IRPSYGTGTHRSGGIQYSSQELGYRWSCYHILHNLQKLVTYSIYKLQSDSWNCSKISKNEENLG